jgi:hypothetical protein
MSIRFLAGREERNQMIADIQGILSFLSLPLSHLLSSRLRSTSSALAFLSCGSAGFLPVLQSIHQT